MTRVLTAFALAVAVFAPAAAAQASEITVTAEGRSTAMPDMATASFAIATYASSAASATSENNERYQRLLNALRGLGVGETDIRTTSFSVSYSPPPKPPAAPEPGARYGYTVYRSLGVTVRKLSSVGKVIDTAVAAGVTDINGVAFDNSDSGKQFAHALQDGVERARVQADAMAAAAGLRIVRIKSIQEGAPNRIVPMAQAQVFRAAAPPAPTQIEPSSVETTATVTVTYEAH